ncbi:MULTISPECIES: hypothetical protein [Streptomyces]|uniref:Secreted protein n=1 Tax=Streptomyces bangladeshensis TaxID=295352 RepID=A0ABN3BGE2_9ACTN|nr:hypothetical protein [Streptomyces sp. EAS-AB2608]BCM66623.1 hypothetical protein EASAB2608_01957 [Streptomyces sp. EAS-AB2608]
MSTGLIILLIVIAAVVVLGAATALVVRGRGRRGGPSLQRRFGPEYDRTVALYDGDTQAAERELTERLERHGDLRERPLDGAERQRYTDRWTAVQEHFVDSPREAVAEADRLLGELAAARGYPDGGRYDEQLAALSVHHGDHVEGYRRLHRAARAGAGDAAGGTGGTGGTEELRSALLEARALFDDLTSAEPGRHRAPAGTGRPTPPPASRSHARSHAPWALHRSRPKES